MKAYFRQDFSSFVRKQEGEGGGPCRERPRVKLLKADGLEEAQMRLAGATACKPPQLPPQLNHDAGLLQCLACGGLFHRLISLPAPLWKDPLGGVLGRRNHQTFKRPPRTLPPHAESNPPSALSQASGREQRNCLLLQQEGSRPGEEGRLTCRRTMQPATSRWPSSP